MGGTTSSFTDEMKNVTNVVGRPTNSSSPTDTWVVTYTKNKKETNLFWKMFVTSTKINENPVIKGLNYEINVYKIIKPIIDENVCPFFLEYLHHYENVTSSQLLELTNDDINLAINKKYMVCQSIVTENDKKIFKSPLLDESTICSERSIVLMKTKIPDDYQQWMTLHKFSFIPNFDCFKLDADKKDKKRPMFDENMELTLELQGHLKNIGVVEFNRFIRELRKLPAPANSSAKPPANSLTDSNKLIRRYYDSNYKYDDIFLTHEEKIDSFFRQKKLQENIVNKDDLFYVIRNGNFAKEEIPNFLNEAEQEKKKSEITSFFTTQKTFLDSVNYTILITRSTPPGTLTLEEFIQIMIQNPREINNYYQDFLRIYLQICIACYTMSLLKMTHNDLHDQNIFIIPLNNPELFVVYVDGVQIKFLTNYKVMIYDFDRAYVKQLGNNASLVENNCKKGQCNKIINNLDIFKISCYFSKIMVNGQPEIAKAIYPLISNNPFELNQLYSKYPHCFYDIDGLETTINSLLFSTTDIIGNIYNKINPTPTVLDLNIKKHVSCINKNYFSEDGILDVDLQKNAIGILTEVMYTRPNDKFVILPSSDSTPPPTPPPPPFFNPSTFLPPGRYQRENMEIEDLDGKNNKVVRSKKKRNVGKSGKNVVAKRKSGKRTVGGNKIQTRKSSRRGSDHPVKK